MISIHDCIKQVTFQMKCESKGAVIKYDQGWGRRYLDGGWNKMMNFCWGMNFFLGNVLGYKNKNWILAKKLNSEKLAIICRFYILITR